MARVEGSANKINMSVSMVSLKVRGQAVARPGELWVLPCLLNMNEYLARYVEGAGHLLSSSVSTITPGHETDDNDISLYGYF